MMETSSKYLLQMSPSIGVQQVSCFSAEIKRRTGANYYSREIQQFQLCMSILAPTKGWICN